MRLGGVLKVAKAPKPPKVIRPKVTAEVESVLGPYPIVSCTGRIDWLELLLEWDKAKHNNGQLRLWMASIGLQCDKDREYQVAKGIVKDARAALCLLPPSAIEMFPERKRQQLVEYRERMIERAKRDPRYRPAVAKIEESEGRVIDLVPQPPPTMFYHAPRILCPACGAKSRFNLTRSERKGQFRVQCKQCRTLYPVRLPE